MPNLSDQYPMLNTQNTTDAEYLASPTAGGRRASQPVARGCGRRCHRLMVYACSFLDRRNLTGWLKKPAIVRYSFGGDCE